MALSLITGLEVIRETDAAFWRSLATRVVLELDERGRTDEVTWLADLLSRVWDSLEPQHGEPPPIPSATADLERRVADLRWFEREYRDKLISHVEDVARTLREGKVPGA